MCTLSVLLTWRTSVLRVTRSTGLYSSAKNEKTKRVIGILNTDVGKWIILISYFPESAWRSGLWRSWLSDSEGETVNKYINIPRYQLLFWQAHNASALKTDLWNLGKLRIGLATLFSRFHCNFIVVHKSSVHAELAGLSGKMKRQKREWGRRCL